MVDEKGTLRLIRKGDSTSDFAVGPFFMVAETPGQPLTWELMEAIHPDTPSAHQAGSCLLFLCPSLFPEHLQGCWRYTPVLMSLP